MKDKNSFYRKAGVRMGIVIGIVFAMVYVMVGPVPVIDRDWHVVWESNLAGAAEADPGSGAGGILEIFFINHSAGNDYSSINVSGTLEGWCTANNLGYVSSDDFNLEIGHSTSFDVVVRVRANKTQAWRTDKFFDTDVKVEWTSSDLSVGADTAMTRAATRNDTAEDFIWLNFYDDNSGSGYSLSKDASADISSFKLSCYY